MTVSIDVCGAIEILLQKEKAGKFADKLREAAFVVAPDLYVPELTNTLWKYHRAKYFPKDECVRYIQDGLGFVDRFIPCNDVWQEAFLEGINNGHSIYDMFYMVVARRHGGLLVTNDQVLTAICGKNNVPVCH